MQQGDQYAIPLVIKRAGEPVTPDNVEGLKISLAGELKRYPGGGLSFDAASGAWLFPVTQEQTLALDSRVAIQVQANYGGSPATIVTSAICYEYVSQSIIQGVWDD